MNPPLKVVVLDCPYETFSNPEANLLFGESIRLRLQGYQDAFGEKVFPLDASDFIGTHTLICETVGDKLRALVTYKTTSIKRCRTFKVPFPISSLASSVGKPEYLSYAKRLADESLQSAQDIVYHGSWTSDPVVRKTNRPLADLLGEAMAAVSTYQSLHCPPRREIIAGNIRFKTDRFFGELGYKVPDEGGSPLPGFDILYATTAEPAVIMELSQFSPKAHALVEKYRDLCEGIQFISASTIDRPEVKAA